MKLAVLPMALSILLASACGRAQIDAFPRLSNTRPLISGAPIQKTGTLAPARVLVSDFGQVLARYSLPIFQGFEERAVQDGDALESEVLLGSQVRTRVSRKDDRTELTGELSGGAGTYRLVIEGDHFEFDQSVTIDAVIVQPEGFPEVHYISTARRFMLLSHSSGTLSQSDPKSGSAITSRGTGRTAVLELVPSTLERGQIRSREDFDLTPGPFDPASTSAYLYDLELRSNGARYGVRTRERDAYYWISHFIEVHPDLGSILGILLQDQVPHSREFAYWREYADQASIFDGRWITTPEPDSDPASPWNFGW